MYAYINIKAVEVTCQIFLQEILEAKKHNLTELSPLIVPALKIGIDLTDIWRVLLVVGNLKKKEDVYSSKPLSHFNMHD